MRAWLGLVSILMTTTSLSAGASEPFERILLPITSADTPGAFGALWTTELWLRNDSDRPSAFSPVILSHFAAPSRMTIAPPIFRPPASSPPGQFVYVTRELADDIRFSIRVRDASRPDGAGAEIPVIRERDFFHKRLVLIDVPLAATSRAALRIYGTPEVEERSIRLRVFEQNGTNPLVDQMVVLVSRVPLLYNPQFAQVLGLADAFPSLQGIDRARIEISSDDESAGIWAFVALTSNLTNAVTIVTPQ